MQHRQRGENNMQVEQPCAKAPRVLLAFPEGRRIEAFARAVINPLLGLLLCATPAVAQESLRTVVENAKAAPVVLIPFADGPGFTVRNVSQRAVTRIQFACVAPGSTNAQSAKVRFKMLEQPLDLDSSGPGSQQNRRGYGQEQSICAHQGSAITVLEVAFKGGKKWRLPHQVRDDDYTYDKSEGDSMIR